MTVIVLNANMKSLVALIFDMHLSNSKSGCLLPSRSSLLFTAAKTLTSVSCATRQVVTHLGHDEVPNSRNTLQHFYAFLALSRDRWRDRRRRLFASDDTLRLSCFCEALLDRYPLMKS